MDRVRRLIVLLCCCVLVCLALLSSSFAIADVPSQGTFSSEGAAYSACDAYRQAHVPNVGTETFSCFYHSSPPLVTAPWVGCSSGVRLNTAWYDVVMIKPSYTDNGYSGNFFWCASATCSGSWGDSGHQFSTGPGAVADTADTGSCCVQWVSSSTWTYPSKSGAAFSGQDGYYQRTGTYCGHNYYSNGGQDSPGHDRKFCDSGATSCYDPQKNTACYTTDSGEQVCKQLDGDTSNCATGATGAMCVGKNGQPSPTPPDPPINKGDPPTMTGSGSTTDNSTSITNNYTYNNYSGTSDGGSGSGSPASGSSGGQSAGTGSNSNGNGNTGKNGTDSTGKCPNGSMPTASGCSGTYSDNGCNTPPACYGDAVMCGEAREMHAVKCNTQKMAAASGSSSGANYGDPSSALAGAGIPADGGASTDPGTSGLVSSSDIGGDGFDSSGLGFSRTCPANPTFNVSGHSYEFDLVPFCNFASLLGWFVLLVACLVGLRIVATGKA